jgi:hypothetical protein
LHRQAKSELEKSSSSNKSSGRLVFLIVFLLTCLIGLFFGIANQLQLLRVDNGGQSPALFSGVDELSAEGQAHFSAAWVLGSFSLPNVDLTQEPAVLLPTARLETQDTNPATLDPQEKAYVPLLSSGYKTCKPGDEIRFEVVSGPDLDPPLKSKITANRSPLPRAAWVIHNDSSCSWNKLRLYSLHNGATVTPRISRNGEDILEGPGVDLAIPGSILVVFLEFDLNEADDITDEYILVINDQQLFPMAHLSLDVNNWITVQQAPAKNSDQNVSGSAATKDGSSSSGNAPGRGQQTAPSRSTEAPPARP